MAAAPLIIGLSGYAQTGKSTAADFLKNTYGYQHRAFADALRAMARSIDPPLVVPALSGGNPTLTSFLKVEERFGYEGAKARVPEFREFLKRLGMSARDNICRDVWVKAALRGLHREAVFSDVRFINEERALRHAAENLDGKALIVRLVRPGHGPESDFEKEVDSIRADYTVVNEGPVTEFYNRLARMMSDVTSDLPLLEALPL